MRMRNPQINLTARALGGEVAGRQVLCPGPNHNAKDRSLSVRLDPSAPDGFVTHSFAGDDPIACRDYVRARVGLPPFKPNGRGIFYMRSFMDEIQYGVRPGGGTVVTMRKRLARLTRLQPERERQA